jgi:hypothetical protein
MIKECNKRFFSQYVYIFYSKTDNVPEETRGMLKCYLY